MTKLSLVTLLVIVCLQLLGCRQSRPPDTPVASHTQQAIVTPIPTYTPIAQSVTQQRNSQSVVPEADVSKARATPTTEIVPVPTSPTATATATRQPTATATRQPTATPTPEYYVTGSANLRSGPGTNYDIVGGRQSNDVLSPLARTTDGEWIQIDNNIWIWSGLVEGDVEKLPVTLRPTPTFTSMPVPTQSPAITQRSNADNPDVICTTHYTTQQAKEDCWWRYHNGLPLIRPTPQPIMPTPTPTPTLTPIPTPTQQQSRCISRDADYYNDLLIRIADMRNMSQVALGALDLFQDDNYIIRDSNWMQAMSDIIASMDNLISVQFNLPYLPSRAASSMHRQYHEMYLTFADATDALRAGVKHKNFGAFYKGDVLLGEAVKMQDAIKRLLRIVCRT